MNPALDGEIEPRPRLWQPAQPGRVELGQDEVHLWRLDLEDPPVSWDELDAWLDGSERDRAAGFGSQRLRRRFVAGRGLLRRILAGYADADPAELRFEQGRHGKPRLRAPLGEIEFNMAHCEDLALVVVGRGRELGVDLERLRRISKARQLAARYFSPAEQRWMDAKASAGIDTAFLELWCRKEACLKATGEALSRALGSVAVGLVEDGWVREPDTESEWGKAGDRHCGLRRVDLEDHVAVVAWADPGEPPRLRARHWDQRA